MISVLDKKLIRTYRKQWGQFLAVVMVVVVGTACYITFAAAMRNLILTRDSYYAQYRFADFEIMLERAPVTAVFKIEDIPGVRNARARIVEDAKAEIEGVSGSRILRLISMPDTQQPVLNDIALLSGRYFDGAATNEVVISDRFAAENNLEIGDNVKITLNNKKHSLRIVGRALSPEYLWMIRNVEDMLPAPERFGILWVPESYAESVLDMHAACNNIVGAVDSEDGLNEILDRAEKILEPYGVFAKVKRENQISYKFLSEEIRGLQATVRIIPPIFLGISSLILLIVLNRMVRNERTQIGLLKAYGYSNLSVASHYLKFGLILCVAGCLGAFVVGQWLADRMMAMYGEYYQFPMLRSRIYPVILVKAMGISIAAGVVGAIYAARSAVKIHPAESMRPSAPRSGKRVWLERFTAIWRRLSFTWKMVVRNAARNPIRSGFNLGGAAVSTLILVLGYTVYDSFMYMIDFQYEKVQREDMRIGFVSSRSKAALYEVSRFDHVRMAEPLLQYPFEVRSAWRTKDVVVFGLPRNARLQLILDDQERPVDIGDQGIVLPTFLAGDLGVEAGDTLILKPLMGRVTDEKTVRVSQVVPQYMGMYAYMNIDALSRILDEPMAMNAAYLKVERGMDDVVNENLKDVPGVSTIELKSESIENMNETLAQSMWIMNVMIIGFSGVIAFAIIYNVTLVSLAERERELASLRVLGFSNKQVGNVMYFENFLLAGLGIVLGIPSGLLAGKAMVRAFQTEIYRMPHYVETRTLAVCAAGIAVFVILANLAVRRKIYAIDLVESLKAPE